MAGPHIRQIYAFGLNFRAKRKQKQQQQQQSATFTSCSRHVCCPAKCDNNNKFTYFFIPYFIPIMSVCTVSVHTTRTTHIYIVSQTLGGVSFLTLSLSRVHRFHIGLIWFGLYLKLKYIFDTNQIETGKPGTKHS